MLHWRWFFCGIILFTVLFAVLFTVGSASALTTVQTSTSMGYFRDYKQTAHFPLYHSWSLHGFYDSGVETSLNFLLDNDFAINTWNFFPTQAEVTVPLSDRWEESPERQSRLRVGRQLFTEGFDLALLDGARAPVYWSAKGGFMPLAGALRSPDMDQSSDNSTPILGLVLWQEFWGLKGRAGYTAREKDFLDRYAFAGLEYQFENIIWQPQFFAKEEWNASDFTFNQAMAEMSLSFTESWMGRVAYSNLEPRPTQKKDNKSFVYRSFAISPTEAVMADLSWEISDSWRFSLGGEQVFYNSGYQNERALRQDASLDIKIGPGWFTPSLTHMTTYGGEITDSGLRYVGDLSSKSRYHLEYDLAYIKKINGIEGWVQHARTGYETMITNRAKGFFGVEVERNQYYEFDVRTMAYVTNYF